MFDKVLIANRGEVAVRVIRACRDMGIKTVAVYSTADADALHVQLADEAYCIGGPRLAESYLNDDAVLTCAVKSGAKAIHPGYGFFSEKASFVRDCDKFGLAFVGPSAEVIDSMGDKDAARRTAAAAGVPIVPGCDLLKSPEEATAEAERIGYPVMLKAISEAKERVFLSSFIFGYDEVGKSFAAALRAAAERGCDVRLLMDGVGSFHLWPSWRKRLGPDVKLAYFLPPRLIPPQFSINLRTHRKVLICDSETGFTGGMNISQNHLANLKRRSRVQDVHFRCLGPIAQQLEIAFLMDWSFATGDHTNFTVHPVKKQGSSLCRILMDGPGTPEDTILDLVCAQISAARHSVRIMSPYFLPPHRLHGELVSAVLRGVDVSVILPGENNHRLVDWAMRHQMPMLADRGVKIYRQPPPFAHTKLLLIDGEYTLLGSANLDPRSLNLNFELVMEVLDLRLAEQLSAFYDEVRSRSVSVPTTYPALPYRLRNAASWIFSPYL